MRCSSKKLKSLYKKVRRVPGIGIRALKLNKRKRLDLMRV